MSDDNNMIDRAGAQPIAGERTRNFHEKRHPQTGRFFDKARAPVKAPTPRNKRRRPSLPPRGS